MGRKKHQPLGRLELLLRGYYQESWFSPKVESYGAYNVEEHRFLSYENELSDEQIHHIIRTEVKRSFPSITHRIGHIPNIGSKLIAVYYFMHVPVQHEEDALIALMAPEERRGDYWDRWGVLDNGSILNPQQTEPFLSSFSGNEYNTITVPSYNIDTQEVTY